MTPEQISEAREEYAKCNWATPAMAATGEFFEWGDVYGGQLLAHIQQQEKRLAGCRSLIEEQDDELRELRGNE